MATMGRRHGRIGSDRLLFLLEGHGQCSCASGAVPHRWGSSSGLSLTHTTTLSSLFTMLYRLSALGILLLIPISTYAQTASNILCIPGQCLQGSFNTTIGATVSNSASSIHLLPGVYTSTTNPQLLHNLITSSSPSVVSTAGFNVSTPITLPLSLQLQPGLSQYGNPLYSGSASFTGLPSTPNANISTPITAGSLALSPNVWVALSTASNRFIVWDAVPDFSQLPASNLGTLSIKDIQSAACSPTCSSAGVCTAAGTCQCSAGFTGASCETCAAGFFGPKCQACPANCDSCDDGITGTGQCLKPTVSNAPSSCNCQNGVCGSNGQCACNSGFTTGSDGTLCSKCAPGFFQTSTGDCQVCQLGCTQCADGTGVCTTCKAGFSQDTTDKTKCDPPPAVSSNGGICPDGSFANGASGCSPCSSACQTCTGGTANDCIVCASGTFTLNGTCVTTDANGVCTGTNLIADNNKRECDSCGAKCVKCRIPNFSVASTVDQKQCTQCLPGSFLNNGICVDSCPAGTTISSQDNTTCIPCDSSCTTCNGSSTFCLTCPNNQLASNGKCIPTCPSGTFSSAGKCLTCHPDCASCSGGAFNQCTACPANRPVLTGGRCIPTCSKNQFFDTTSGACQSCDASCSSCSAAGPSNCLACAGSTQRLQGGTCVAANCQSSSDVVPGLGVCLSDLVVQAASPTGGATPAPTGIDSPIVVNRSRGLQWWQILLMALGCALIFLTFVWCCCRRRQKRRAQNNGDLYMQPRRTGWRWRLVYWVQGLFHRKPKAHQPPLDDNTTPVYFNTAAANSRGNAKHSAPEYPAGWKATLMRWGEKLFGHGSPTPATLRPTDIVLLRRIPSHDETDDGKLRAVEEARHVRAPPSPRGTEVDMVNLIDSYNKDPPRARNYYYPQEERRERFPVAGRPNEFLYHDPFGDDARRLSDLSSHSAGSLYSQATGMPRKVQEPRLPLRSELSSRFSASTYGVHQQPSESKPRPFVGKFF